MEKAFALEIVTPRKTIFSGQVTSFTAPGVLGSFQILYNHAPLLAAIGVGEARLVSEDGSTVRFAVSGGFVEVHGNRVVMLAETAERKEEIDVARAREALTRAQQRLTDRAKGIDSEQERLALSRAQNRIRIAHKQ